MRVEIHRNENTPVYMQIFQQIRSQILSGEILPGFRLPAERKLAERLGVNRTTVLNAYNELKSEGLVGSHVGKGTVVLSGTDEDLGSYVDRASEPAWSQILSQYAYRDDSSLVKDLLSLVSRKDVISFATGIADPETGPRKALEGIEKEIVENGD